MRRFTCYAVAAALPLALLARAKPARAVSSSEIITVAAYRYGKFEARVQYPEGDGVVGSFFLWKTGSELAGTFWNELDFEKLRASCVLQLNDFYGDPEVSHTSLPAGLSGQCTGYHSYSFEWTPSYIAWGVDGKEVRRDTGDAAKVFVDHAPEGMDLDFNNWPGTTDFAGAFSPAILPVREYISWVQYSTYTPGAGADGSDFTLSWRDSFESGVGSAWTRGTWASPHGHSTHAVENVTASNGVAVLSLTDDAAKGGAGAPPVDPGDLPSFPGAATSGAGAGGAPAGGAATGGTAGVAGGVSVGGTSASGGASAGGSTAVGGTLNAAGTNSSAGSSSSDNSGCSCRIEGSSQAPAPWLPAAFSALLGLMARRRRAR